MWHIDGDGVLTDRDNDREWQVAGMSREFHDGNVIVFIEKTREGWNVYYEFASDRGYPYLAAENISLSRAFDRAQDIADKASERRGLES